MTAVCGLRDREWKSQTFVKHVDPAFIANHIQVKSCTVISNVHKASRWRAIFTFIHFPGETRSIRETCGIHSSLLKRPTSPSQGKWLCTGNKSKHILKRKKMIIKMLDDWVRLVEVAHGPSSICSVHSFFISMCELWASSDKYIVCLFSMQDGSTRNSMREMGIIQAAAAANVEQFVLSGPVGGDGYQKICLLYW